MERTYVGLATDRANAWGGLGLQLVAAVVTLSRSGPAWSDLLVIAPAAIYMVIASVDEATSLLTVAQDGLYSETLFRNRHVTWDDVAGMEVSKTLRPSAPGLATVAVFAIMTGTFAMLFRSGRSSLQVGAAFVAVFGAFIDVLGRFGREWFRKPSIRVLGRSGRCLLQFRKRLSDDDAAHVAAAWAAVVADREA